MYVDKVFIVFNCFEQKNYIISFSIKRFYSTKGLGSMYFVPFFESKTVIYIIIRI